jgi:hypothetical protein
LPSRQLQLTPPDFPHPLPLHIIPQSQDYVLDQILFARENSFARAAAQGGVEDSAAALEAVASDLDVLQVCGPHTGAVHGPAIEVHVVRMGAAHSAAISGSGWWVLQVVLVDGIGRGSSHWQTSEA